MNAVLAVATEGLFSENAAALRSSKQGGLRSELKIAPKHTRCALCKQLKSKVNRRQLCDDCCRRNGVQKLATHCKHKGERLLYSVGLCQQCYMKQYNETRKK